MIISDHEDYQYNGEEFDYIIVGGGTVGLFLASQLDNTDQRVLVLESGIRQFSKANQELNQAVQVGRKHNGIDIGRARTLGGTSTLWGGQLARFTASDFAGASGTNGISAWPLSFDEVCEYYSKAGALLGLKTHDTADAALAREVGAARDIEFGSAALIYTRWLRQPNFAVLFGEQLERSKTVTVLTGAMVTELALAPGGRRVSAVRVHRGAHAGFEARAKTVVIANGTRAAHPDAAWLHNRWIGLSFQDHLDLVVGSVKITDDTRFRNLFENVIIRGEKLQPKLRLSDESIKTLKVNNIAASFKFESSITESLTHVKTMVRSILSGKPSANIFEAFKHLIGSAAVWGPLVWRYLSSGRIRAISDRGVFLLLHCEQSPLDESAIRLSATERDRMGLPLIELDWRIDGHNELRTVKAMIGVVQELLTHNRIGSLTVFPEFVADDQKLLDAMYDSYHQCGGLRMAASADAGVVDAELKVFGTDNLYVAGAVTFPTSSFANPTFTALALAARLLERLREPVPA